MSNAFSSTWGLLAAWLPQVCTFGRVPINNFAKPYLTYDPVQWQRVMRNRCLLPICSPKTSFLPGIPIRDTICQFSLSLRCWGISLLCVGSHHHVLMLCYLHKEPWTQINALFTVTDYYREKWIENKINKGKLHTGQSSDRPVLLKVYYTIETPESAWLPAIMCDYTCEVSSTRKPTQTLVCRSIMRSKPHKHRAPT